jgi:hypothetical protein
VRSHLRRSRLVVTGALLLALAPSDPISAAPLAAGTTGAATEKIPVVTDERTALETIEDCQQRSSQATDPFDPVQRCPDLIDAVEALGLDQQLQRNWRSHLDATALGGLHELLQRYRSVGARAASTAPDLARLPLALRSLNASAPTHRSWWQRFERWLEQLLSPQTRGNNAWLAQLLSGLSIPRLVQELLLYLSIAALLAMAAWIIWRELEAAGLLSRHKRSERTGRSDGAPAPRAAELAFEDLQQAPAGERCVWLLRLLVQGLRRSGRLSRESTLTYRELAARPMFDDLQQRARFERLALLAERQRYGSLSLDDAQWLQLLEEGRSLYAHWLSPAAAPAPDGAASAAA